MSSHPISSANGRLVHDLYLRHGEELRRFLGRWRGRAEAQDLLQETFLRFLQHDRSGLANPRAFLYRIAANLAADDYRKACFRTSPRAEDEGWLSADSAPAQIDDAVAAADAGIELRRVWAALSELPAPCRQAFLMSRFEGFTHREIAGRLAISEKTVERHISRALACCLDVLDGESSAGRPKSE